MSDQGKIGRIGIEEIPAGTSSVLAENEEEFLIATGDTVAGAGWVRGQVYWGVMLDYVGCVCLTDGAISKEKGQLAWDITEEEERSGEYRSYFERNTVYKIRGRRYTNHNGIYVREIVERDVKNAELEAVAEDYRQEVSVESKRLGKLVYDKDYSTYKGRAEWCGETANILLDVGGTDDVQAAVKLLEKFFAKSRAWDKKFRRFAAKELTGLANDWKDSDEALDDTPAITEKEFAKRIHSPDITMDSKGNFTVYYEDDDMFWGHVVTVDGNVKTGIASAQMEG